MNRIFFVTFAMQSVLLLVATSVGLVAAQNDSSDTTTTQAIGNLTNATSNPEDIKQMKVIGGTVNATLNQSSADGMTDNMSSGANISAAGGTEENYK